MNIMNNLNDKLIEDNGKKTGRKSITKKRTK